MHAHYGGVAPPWWLGGSACITVVIGVALCATRTPHKRPECADETSKVGFRDELLTDEYLLKCLDDSGVSESRFANLRTKYHIIERIQAAIVILKECRCERDRQFYHALLTACAPVPVAFGCCSGWQRAIAELLGVNKQNATFVAAIERRKEIDDAEASRVRGTSNACSVKRACASAASISAGTSKHMEHWRLSSSRWLIPPAMSAATNVMRAQGRLTHRPSFPGCTTWRRLSCARASSSVNYCAMAP